jgi:hypothetical protein
MIKDQNWFEQNCEFKTKEDLFLRVDFIWQILI